MVLVVTATWRSNGKFFSVVLQREKENRTRVKKLIVSDSLKKQVEQRCEKLLSVIFYCKPNSHLVVLVLI